MQRALIVVGLGFGDEGKGSVVDWLVRRHDADLVVRYNGGPQAAHHVVLADGRMHCFAQLGAGALQPGVRTFLSRYMLVDPLALQAEVRVLLRCLGEADPATIYERLFIDPRCVLVTPFHRCLNQLRELARGPARHGSCGRGVAEAQLDSERRGLPVLRLAAVREPEQLLGTLRLLWQVKVDQAEQLVAAVPAQHPELPQLRALLAELQEPHRVPQLARAYAALFGPGGPLLTEMPPPARTAVFEGAQGVLLDREHGFFPHVTPSRTTAANALALLAEWAPTAERVRVGVLRAYATRHGNGPLPTEDARLTAQLPERHNGADRWQGRFRVGWFDALLAGYALHAAGGVEALVLTCLDRLAGLGPLRQADSYLDPERQQTLHALPVGRAELPGLGDRSEQTRRLSTLQPRYCLLPGWDEGGLAPPARAYVEQLGERLGVAVAAVSLGPTAQDKQVLRPDAPL